MKLLLHICCAPCSIYPLKQLRSQSMEIMGYFYRANIHPYQELLRRQQALEAYAEQIGLKVIYQEDYDLEGFLQNIAFREGSRCRCCYHARLTAAALIARRGRFDAFSTTLLYSRYQRHDLIRSIGEAVARSTGVEFHYEDFRTGWQEGIDASKQLGMYRQQYCGCIYSEKDRYFRPAS